MDFQELVAKMQAIDTAQNAPVETKTDECGMPPMAPNMPAPEPKDKASMTININAQGDAIQDVMDLLNKMKDNDKPSAIDMPTMSIMPPMGGMDEPEGPPMPKPINKLLPDFDGDNDDMPGGEKDSMDLPKDHDDDHVMIKSLDKDGDKDHDMDDHDMEKDDDEEDKKDKEEDDDDKDELDILKAAAGTVNSVGDIVGSGPTNVPRPSSPDTTVGSKAQSADKDEAWANEPDEDERSVHYQMNKLQGGMNRRKGTHPKVAGGDNPMQKVGESDLVATIRAELSKALAETKGAK